MGAERGRGGGPRHSSPHISLSHPSLGRGKGSSMDLLFDSKEGGWGSSLYGFLLSLLTSPYNPDGGMGRAGRRLLRPPGGLPSAFDAAKTRAEDTELARIVAPPMSRLPSHRPRTPLPVSGRDSFQRPKNVGGASGANPPPPNLGHLGGGGGGSDSPPPPLKKSLVSGSEARNIGEGMFPLHPTFIPRKVSCHPTSPSPSHLFLPLPTRFFCHQLFWLPFQFVAEKPAILTNRNL